MSKSVTNGASRGEVLSELFTGAAAAARRSFTTPEAVAIGLEEAAVSAADPLFTEDPVFDALAHLADAAFITSVRNHAPLVDPFTAAAAPTFARDLAAAARVIHHDIVWQPASGTPAHDVAKLLGAIADEHATSAKGAGTVPQRILIGAQFLAQSMLAQPIRDSYPTQCVLALFYALHPNDGLGITPLVYELNGITYEVLGHPVWDTDVAAWRHSPADGWSYTLRPFDVGNRDDQERARSGQVEWHEFGPLWWPSVGQFIDQALAVIAQHKDASEVQA